MITAQSGGWCFDWHDTWSDVWTPAVDARWSTLLARDAAAHVYHDPRVVRAWAETHGRAIGAEPMFGFATDAAGREVFVTWAVVAQRGRYAGRRSLIHAGDAFFGYHNPLVARDDRDAIDWASFWQAAREAVGPAVDQALLRLVDPRYAAGPLTEASSELSPVLSLSDVDSFASLLDRCSASHRGDVGRQIRRLRAEGELTLSVHRDARTAGAALESFHNHFVPAYAAHWRPRPEGCMLDRPGVAAFVERVVDEGVRDGWAHYDVLTLGGKPIAWHIGLTFRSEAYWWIPAHDEAWQGYSPGKVLLALFIEHAIASGVAHLHFLTGAHKYKLDWQPHNLALSSVRWHAPSVKGTALAWYDAGRRLVSR
jgi:CelD/BcsL family acetyltransferase involved in cellulose biosynthesis